jgi:hypothetical protein
VRRGSAGWTGFALAVLVGSVASSGAWAAEPEGAPLFRSGPATSLEVARGDARIRLEAGNGRWWVTQGDGPRRLADRAGVEALLARVDALRTVRPVARFGTPLPAAFTEPLEIARGTERVRIGGASRIPGLVYARLGDGTLHLMRPVRLDPAALRLVDRRLFPDGLGPVTEIDLSGPDLVMHLSREFGPWRFTAPTPSAAEDPAIEAWLSRLAGLAGDPAPKPVPADARYAVTLTRRGEGPVKLALSNVGQVVLDGTALKVDGPAEGLVPTRFDWLEKVVARIRPMGMTGIQVQQAETTVVLARHGDEPWTEKGTGRVYKGWTTDLFALLDPLPAIGLWDGSAEALGTADVEVRLWQENDLVATIELWMDEDNRWWARGGDAVTVFEIPEDLPRHLARIF